MGNCFGKTSGNFKGQGRTLGAQPAPNAPAQPRAAAAPPPKISAPQGPGRTLGKNPQAPAESADPRSAAAKAAEKRARATQGKGKLGKQLDAQKAQTQTGTLEQNARDNVAARDADANATARNWD